MKSKKLIAMLLVVVMVFSVTSVAAFAEDGGVDPDLSGFNDGTGYVAFGDSITRGYGALPKWEDWSAVGYRMDNYDENDSKPEYYNCRNVEGSYPWIVANALGCKSNDSILDENGKYWPIAQDAVTTSYILDLLGIEDNYYDSEYLSKYPEVKRRYETSLHYFGVKGVSMNSDGTGTYAKEPTVMGVDELLSNASLVSIAIGMGDVLNRARSLATDDFLENGDFSDTSAILGVVKNLIAKMYEGYDYWLNHYPEILKYMRDNAKGAEVVIVGAINPAFNMTITDDVLLPVGSALTAITTLMNQHYKQWAEEYGFIYVDISNVETGATEDTIGITEFLSMGSYEMGKATHPTPAGYQQIARMIIAALKEHEGKAHTAKTDIRVNLGRLADVNYVRVNGNTIHNYTVDEDGFLTIHYGSTSAKSLTVSAVREDGKVAVTHYQLSFDKNGYSAYRIYTTNDVFGVLSSVLNNIKSLFTKLFSLFQK